MLAVDLINDGLERQIRFVEGIGDVVFQHLHQILRGDEGAVLMLGAAIGQQDAGQRKNKEIEQDHAERQTPDDDCCGIGGIGRYAINGLRRLPKGIGLRVWAFLSPDAGFWRIRQALSVSLRACSRSFEDQNEKGQVDELQAGVEFSLAVFP